MKKIVFKPIVILAFALLALGVGYYFGLYLPKAHQDKIQQEHQELILAKKVQCQEVGERFHQKNQKDSNSILAPFYAYNEDLNTCLYRSGIILNTNPPIINMWVQDTYTQKEIITTTYSADGKKQSELGLSKEEFEKQAFELMGI